MRRLLASAAILSLLAGIAAAQVNVVPQVGVNTANIRQQTYSAVSIGLTPATSSATDILCIDASASKTVSVKQISVSGTVATTAVTIPFVVLRRATLDTGGTAATGTALPVAGKNVSTNGASTATLVAYTANPTITDSSPTYLRAQSVPLPVAGTPAVPVNFQFGVGIEPYDQSADLVAGSTQQLCVNLASSTITNAGNLNIYLEWTEQ